MTSPFFTFELGFASFTDTTMMSPSEAYLRRDPPSTLMHSTRRAPELSATSSTDSDCTIVPRRPSGSALRSNRLLQHRADAPALVLAQRPRLRDQDPIADVASVVLVVHFVVRSPADVLLVLWMLHQAFDRDDDRLLHLVADDHTFSDFRSTAHDSCPISRTWSAPAPFE